MTRPVLITAGAITLALATCTIATAQEPTAEEQRAVAAQIQAAQIDGLTQRVQALTVTLVRQGKQLAEAQSAAQACELDETEGE